MGQQVSASRGAGRMCLAVAAAAAAAVVEAIERRILFAAFDPTWSGDGVQYEPYPTDVPQRSGAIAVAVLAGDKVLALAEHFDLSQLSAPPTYTLVRYNADGGVDTTFGGGDGILPVAGMARDMVVAPDGTIYLSMSDPGSVGGRSLGVARYLEARNPDGSPKTTFAGDGRYDVTYAGDAGSAGALRIALAPDGDLVAATVSSTRGGTEETPTFAEHTKVVKLNPDGTGDAAFDGDGVLAYDPDDVHPDVADVVVQPSGHVVMLSTSDGQFTRITPGGAVQQFYRPFPGLYPQHIAVQSDGKIVAVENTTFSLQPYYLSVGRLNTDLSLDMSYGTDGVARSPDTNNGTTKDVTAFGIDNQGRAVVIANYVDETSLLLRFTPDGEFDTSVAPGVGLPLDINGALAIAFTPDGKYIVVSQAYAVSRLNSVVSDIDLAGGVLAVRGTSGADTITIAAGGNNIVLTRNGAQATYAASDVERVSVDGLAGNDTITISVDLNATVSGREGNDKITTADGWDTIFGGDGNDTISTGAGGDSVRGEAGNDSITCGDAGVFNGSDLRHDVDGGDGDDTITVGSGWDLINGGAGRNRIVAGGVFDEIWGGVDDDYIEASGGAVIQSYGGNDTIVTGDGDPARVDFHFQFDINTGDGDDSITCGDGVDWIDSGNGADTIFAGGGDDHIGSHDLTDAGANVRIDAGDGNDIVDAYCTGSVIGGNGNDGISVERVESLTGGDGNDLITVRQYITAGGAVFAGAGDDLVRCNSDAEHAAVVHGGDGDDNLYTADGRDTLYGGAGRDRVHAGNASDMIVGGGGNDHLFGQGGHDRLYGGRGNDRMDGQSGNDRFRGGAGADRIDGGAGTNAAFQSEGDEDEDELTLVQSVMS